jgi:hypothetical protein
MSEERAKDPTAPVGPLLENFVIGEVARQLTWAEEPVQLFHYRDRGQVEVDMVMEHAAGTVRGRAATLLRRPANCPPDGRLVDARRLSSLNKCTALVQQIA